MSSSNIKTIPINDILVADTPYNFFIPKYQRGYRWDKKQVTDLLDDILSFTPEPAPNGESTWYCLQPVVVRKKEGANQWEVIDGQQRLTTIRLILHYCNLGYTEFSPNRKQLFGLSYETREGSAQMLESGLKIENGIVKIDNSNIDYYHITTAFSVIYEWFKENKNGNRLTKFESKFLSDTRIIWYEVPNYEVAEEVFTRLNVGKIPLTNAELIKALFLNSRNFTKAEGNQSMLLDEQAKVLETQVVVRKQTEIATEWDRIEYTLQDDSVWHFITHGQKPKENRIELLFDLDPRLNGSNKELDSYVTFRHYAKQLESGSTIEKLWGSILQRFQTLMEWYEENELYHKIGYLVAAGVEVKSLLKDNENSTKTEFRSKLDARIKETLAGVDLNSLSYSSTKLRRVLLLHNILTVLHDSSYRFPFDRYLSESWDIEHVTAVHERAPGRTEQQKAWMAAAAQYLNYEENELRARAESLSQEGTTKEDLMREFEILHEQICAHFGGSTPGAIDRMDHISNLALLSVKINRGYKNDVFPAKRAVIIDWDSKGAFIPPATKNIFLKYYNPAPTNLSFWDKTDRENYMQELEQTLKEFLPSYTLAQ